MGKAYVNFFMQNPHYFSYIYDNDRHAVRYYEDKQIEESVIEALKEELNKCNQEGRLTTQLVCVLTLGYGTTQG